MDDRFGPVERFAALRFANELEAQPLPWLWPQRIPLGKVTLLVGDPGVGKSLLAADLAARVSAALPWPDQPPLPLSEGPGEGPAPNSQLITHNSELGALAPRYPAGVLFVSPEDSPAETLVPRLAAAGADVARICILEGVSPTPRSCVHRSDLPSVPLTLPDHAAELEEAIRAITCPRLVILDPLQALLSPAAHGNPATLLALADIAHRHGVAIVAIGHLGKKRAHRTLYRVRGSLAFVAAARAVHLLSADPEQPDRRILSCIKTVYGPAPPPLAFRIASGPRLLWEPCETSSASGSPSATRAPWQRPDLLDLPAETYSALCEACAWLTDYLAAGPRPARDLMHDAHAAGLGLRTLQRAKRLLSIRSVKFSVDGGWMWVSPQAPGGQAACS